MIIFKHTYICISSSEILTILKYFQKIISILFLLNKLFILYKKFLLSLKILHSFHFYLQMSHNHMAHIMNATNGHSAHGIHASHQDHLNMHGNMHNPMDHANMDHGSHLTSDTNPCASMEMHGMSTVRII